MNKEFSECCHIVFGLPSPTFEHMRNQFIHSKCKTPSPIDVYGMAVANSTCIPGDGFRKRHDRGLKFLLKDIIKTTTKGCFVENQMMFNGQIDSAIYYDYCKSGQQIIPDILVPSYSDSKDLLGEVKIFGIHSDFNNYSANPKKKPMAKKDCSTVKKDYVDKTKALDQEHYKVDPDSLVVGLFQQALRNFHNE